MISTTTFLQLNSYLYSHTITATAATRLLFSSIIDYAITKPNRFADRMSVSFFKFISVCWACPLRIRTCFFMCSIIRRRKNLSGNVGRYSIVPVAINELFILTVWIKWDSVMPVLQRTWPINSAQIVRWVPYLTGPPWRCDDFGTFIVCVPTPAVKKAEVLRYFLFPSILLLGYGKLSHIGFRRTKRNCVHLTYFPIFPFTSWFPGRKGWSSDHECESPGLLLLIYYEDVF